MEAPLVLSLSTVTVTRMASSSELGVAPGLQSEGNLPWLLHNIYRGFFSSGGEGTTTGVCTQLGLLARFLLSFVDLVSKSSPACDLQGHGGSHEANDEHEEEQRRRPSIKSSLVENLIEHPFNASRCPDAI